MSLSFPGAPLAAFPSRPIGSQFCCGPSWSWSYIPILTGCVSLGKCLAPLCLIFLMSVETNTLLTVSDSYFLGQHRRMGSVKLSLPSRSCLDSFLLDFSL